jgi:hypothetical protein
MESANDAGYYFDLDVDHMAVTGNNPFLPKPASALQIMTTATTPQMGLAAK